MATVQVSTKISAEPQRVFELITDFEHAADRINGIDKIEVLTDGPVGVGTKFRETRTMFGREATETMEITEFEPGRSYKTFAENCGCEYVSGFTVNPAEGGCEVVMDFRSTPQTFLAKILSVMMAPMMKTLVKCVQDDLSDLKKFAESEASQPA